MRIFAIAVVGAVLGTAPALAYDPICDHNYYVCMTDAQKRLDEWDRYYAELECIQAYDTCRGVPLAASESTGHEDIAPSATDSHTQVAEQDG
ncbi:hypothetical protein LXT21_33390 [Myxococcus sp. K38C18041901]|uniref:hypothetical protein n=1 Tax=Myxococcus guangdongensis TaxID=2906760 RepID=UPI0020A726C8|nr:hypothetical protein [Myxococcus guangdongensis]MCP3063680.1 hypothetical protein [Myxococcus guangdongensis]